MQFRYIKAEEAALLAPLNHQLISDEGHRNPMTIDDLAARMKALLSQDYEAIVIEDSVEILAYALYRYEPEYVYLRQLFVSPQHRFKGVGRATVNWLSANPWQKVSRIRIEVLSQNVAAQHFWHSLGFVDYALTMELDKSLVKNRLQNEATSSRV